MSRPTITFLGATETVTGSRTLISTDSFRVLVDSGLYQGTSAVEDKNWEKLSIDPATIDAILLTHAHLDHSGYIPRLVRMGFKGSIYATKYTKALASVVLYDSAFLQMEDTKYALKKGFSRHKNPEPLYNTIDVESALELFKVVDYRVPQQIAPNFSVTFHPSGHILGSAFLTVEVEGKNLLFTSDLGRPSHPILTPPDAPPSKNYDVVVSESTYGDRVHDTPTSEFAKEINEAVQRGGSILIPAFAVDRTEVILMALHDLMDTKQIPRIPVFVDSPMALASLNHYRDAITTGAIDIRDDMKKLYATTDPFDPGTLEEMPSTEQSKSLNGREESGIIISASGMATGGRVVHHLANMLPDANNSIILVGFQAAGSRGRALQQGNKEIRIHGDMVPVRAHIANVESFSVHADSDELIHWLKQIARPQQAYVVHGEPEASSHLAQRITQELGWKAEVPHFGTQLEI
ncbi:MAG: hypothetical protein RL414_506 [Actinomycetota bacterium]|jgi:metallo-beta-lactamase family protein